MTLGKKLALGFGTVLFIVVAATAIIYLKAVQADALVTKSIELRAPMLIHTAETAKHYESALAAMRGYFALGDDAAAAERLRNERSAAWKGIDTHFRELVRLSPRFSLQQNKDRVTALQAQLADYRQLQDIMETEAHATSAKARQHAVVMLKEVAAQKAKAVRDNLAALSESNVQLYNQEAAELKAASEATRLAVWISILLACAVAVAVSIVFGKKLSRSLAAVAARADAIASGDLSAEPLAIDSRDEIGRLGKSVNGMQANLHSTIEQVASSAQNMASASEEISSAATQSAEGSRTQSDQVAQVATAMQEMSSTVVEVSKNSTKAAEEARKAAEAARQGGQIVKEALTTMRSIAGSVDETAKKIADLGRNSDQIGKIIAVIDEIADQTNLLALNAAIEAARAGEQGRGFAVVADEVRKLAERTTKATKEIAHMIETVQSETRVAVQKMEAGTKQVEAGVATTARAGASLDEIIGAAQQVGDMIAQIATATAQQTSTAEQVNSNVEQIARIAHESASGAEQAAKACQDLSNLALDLQQLVGRFKMDNVKAGVAPVRQQSSGRTRPSSESLTNKTNGHSAVRNYQEDRAGWVQ
jgi:methyl-accepting chemotaxis protein